MHTLTQELLKEFLSYNPETGIFTWLPRDRKWFKTTHSFKKWNTRYANKEAGTMSHGYVYISIFKRLHKASRLAWLYITGNHPVHNIDHINGVRSYDAFINLRDVPQSQNVQNIRRPYSYSKSGFLGAHPNGSKFCARIKLNGITHYLGQFNTAQEAHDVYLAAKRKLHPACSI